MNDEQVSRIVLAIREHTRAMVAAYIAFTPPDTWPCRDDMLRVSRNSADALLAALSASSGGDEAASGVICGSSAPEPILGQTPRMAGGAPLGLGQSHLAQAATPPLSADLAGIDDLVAAHGFVTVRRDDLRMLLERHGSPRFPHAPEWWLRIREAVGR